MNLQAKYGLRGSGACDCHVHVIGPHSQFPQATNRAYTASVATADSLQAVSHPVGVSRYVLVQPSFYGMDNTFLLKTLDLLEENGRGVVVVDPATVSPRQLKDFTRRGVRGVRVNFYSKVSPLAHAGLENALLQFMEILPRDSWHIEIIATLPSIIAAAPMIRRSPLPVVIDHYGVPEDETPESEAGRAILELMRAPHVWMKLSAPYRVVHDPIATVPPASWLKAFLAVAPDRCVWGSDWPHTPPRREQRGVNVDIPYRKIDYAQLLEDFLAALPDPLLSERILASNPARLYGFRSIQDEQEKKKA